MGKILEVKNLKKTFYKAKKAYTAVDDVSFSAGEASCVGIVGESGCGKSTVFRLINGLEKPQNGEVFFCMGRR